MSKHSSLPPQPSILHLSRPFNPQVNYSPLHFPHFPIVSIQFPNRYEFSFPKIPFRFDSICSILIPCFCWYQNKWEMCIHRNNNNNNNKEKNVYFRFPTVFQLNRNNKKQKHDDVHEEENPRSLCVSGKPKTENL